MALNWNIEKITNYEELQEGNEWQTTDTIIWLTMAIGMRSITKANHKEFYGRIHFIEKLSGAMRSANGKPLYMTLEEVQRRIGLETNAAAYTHNQFINNRAKRFFEDLNR